MKKLLFGMAFMGSMMFTSVDLQAQEEEEEGTYWVCCSIDLRIWCTDRLGYEEGNSYKKYSTTCS